MILTWCLTMTSLILIAYALEQFKESNHSIIGLTSIGKCPLLLGAKETLLTFGEVPSSLYTSAHSFLCLVGVH